MGKNNMEKNQINALIENDVILVYIENQPTFFARVENIAPDYKKGWWRVKLLILQIPLVVTTWILDNDQIIGADFTMGGTSMRIEKVIPPAESEEIDQNLKTHSKEKPPKKQNHQASIISLNSKNEK